MDSITIQRIRSGEAVSEESIEHPLHCSAFCLAAIKLQSELLGLRTREPDNAQLGAAQMLAFLRSQRDFVDQIVRETPRDLMEQESPAIGEIELSPEIAALDAQPVTAADDDLGEIPPPTDPQVQAEADRAERRRRFFAGQNDGL
jgi:hypothetical protein